jgi:hypothetical protein
MLRVRVGREASPKLFAFRSTEIFTTYTVCLDKVRGIESHSCHNREKGKKERK